MTQLREIYYCEKCGNVVEILNEGAPALSETGLESLAQEYMRINLQFNYQMLWS